MKKVLLSLTAMMVVCHPVVAQTEPNAAVLGAFNKKFEDIKEVVWSQTPKGVIADFNEGELGKTVTFAKDGKWVETITYLPTDELPAEIELAIQNEYGQVDVEDALQAETITETVYIVNISTEDDQRYLVKLDVGGKILSSEVQANEEEELYDNY